MLTEVERRRAAQELKTNKLLPGILDGLRQEIVDRWKLEDDAIKGRELWIAQRQLEKLIGHINDECTRILNGGSQRDTEAGA